MFFGERHAHGVASKPPARPGPTSTPARFTPASDNPSRWRRKPSSQAGRLAGTMAAVPGVARFPLITVITCVGEEVFAFVRAERVERNRDSCVEGLDGSGVRLSHMGLEL